MAAILVSVACGAVGTYVVIKRIVSLSGAISHAAFGGVGLGYFLGLNPVVAAIPFSIAAALSMGAIQEKIKISEDTAIGILWSVGMALGILFINLRSGYAQTSSATSLVAYSLYQTQTSTSCWHLTLSS